MGVLLWAGLALRLWGKVEWWLQGEGDRCCRGQGLGATGEGGVEAAGRGR